MMKNVAIVGVTSVCGYIVGCWMWSLGRKWNGDQWVVCGAY